MVRTAAAVRAASRYCALCSTRWRFTDKRCPECLAQVYTLGSREGELMSSAVSTVIVRVQKPEMHPDQPWLVRSQDGRINRYIEPASLPSFVRHKLEHSRYGHFHVVPGDNDRLIFGTYVGDMPW